MITANFFPTTYTDSSSGYERTNTISSKGNGFSAYWLGWMYYDNIPQSMKVSEISFSESRITAQVINIPQNSPVGYVTDNYDYNVDFTGYIKETPFTVSSNQSAYSCYLNGMNCMANAREINISTGNESSTYFMIMRETGTDESLGTHLSPISQPFSSSLGLSTLTDIIDFLKGDKTVTLTTTINSVSIPITITADDLNENYYVETMGNANGTFYRICVFIAGYGTSQNYAKSSATGSGSTTWRTISTLKLFTENGSYYVNKNSGFYYTAFYFDSALTAAYSSNKIANIGFLNGFEFTITKSELQSLVRYAFTFNGNTCFMLDRDYLFMRMYTPSEILHHLALNIRLQERNTPTYGYHIGIYCPEVLDSGEFTGNLLTGELTEDDVQPWQWYNINDNTFTEDEIPPYEPPGPTPGPEGEESGDRIPNNERYFSGAYNFVTQYAMTRQQLGQFGNLLWSSWADQQGITDMWKNFKMFISADPASDTGSIDIASIMDFILSLQVFPFDLSSLLHTDSANVCIGTGQYPLAVSGKKLLTINHILDCGTMVIPRPYNDFRDYENMSITAYLPYCGSVELNPGDVVGRSVSIEYSVDTLSGSCTAVLTAYDNDGYLYNVGMINGQISASIPMTATNSGQIRAQRISDVASLAGLAGNAFLGNISQGAQVASGADSNPIGAISSAVYGTVGRSFNAGLSAQQMFANRFSRGAISCPTLAGGNGIAAFYQPACPYIQMRYGLYEKPANYDHSVGGVSATSNTLSSYRGSGFTVCENVDISGFTCHEEERSEIKSLLESGVYL